jgi:hypothetical protein
LVAVAAEAAAQGAEVAAGREGELVSFVEVDAGGSPGFGGFVGVERLESSLFVGGAGGLGEDDVVAGVDGFADGVGREEGDEDVRGVVGAPSAPPGFVGDDDGSFA